MEILFIFTGVTLGTIILIKIEKIVSGFFFFTSYNKMLFQSLIYLNFSKSYQKQHATFLFYCNFYSNNTQK